MASCCLAKAVCSDVKHNLILHYLLAAVVVPASTMFFSVYELNSQQAAQPLEMVISLIGIILLTPIFMPEQNDAIRDVIRSKKMPYLFICFIRLCSAVLLLMLLVGGFVLYMKHCDSKVDIHHFTGCLASAVALGAVGFFAAGVSNNVIIGYMASLFYYIINFSAKDELGNFYLFSMMSGSFEEKKWLFILSLTFVAATFSYLKFIKKQ